MKYNHVSELMEALKANEVRGVRYHHPGKVVGDYDLPESEEDIISLIMRGLSAGENMNEFRI